MNVTVIRHVTFESLGNIEQSLTARNCNIQILDAPQAKLLNLLDNQPDLLVILGGPISVNDTEDYPFINDELAVLKQRLAQDLPTIGICLGAQMIAKALGAKVYPGTVKEIGWAPLQVENIEHCNAIAHLSADNTPLLHWHGETFDLPEGAIRVASSALYKNQAFVYGRNTLALQFHPEVTAETLELWYVGHTSEIATVEGISVGQLRRDAQLHSEALQQAAEQFWIEWLDGLQ